MRRKSTVTPRSLSLIFLVACSPAANRQAAAEAQVQIDVASYGKEVRKCRTDARAAFEACIAKGDVKAECKGRALVQFDTCADVADAKYNDAGRDR